MISININKYKEVEIGAIKLGGHKTIIILRH